MIYVRLSPNLCSKVVNNELISLFELKILNPFCNLMNKILHQGYHFLFINSILVNDCCEILFNYKKRK